MTPETLQNMQKTLGCKVIKFQGYNIFGSGFLTRKLEVEVLKLPPPPDNKKQ